MFPENQSSVKIGSIYFLDTSVFGVPTTVVEVSLVFVFF
jgi:hypothetical protein